MKLLLHSLLSVLAALSLSTPALAQSRGAVDPEVAELLALFDHEPTVRQVQEAALRWANLHHDRVPGWYRQVRLSAFVPRVRIDGRTRTHERDQSDRTENFDVDGENFRQRDQRLLQRDYAYTEYDVRGYAQWELRELVWSSDILRVSQESHRIARVRQDLATTVTSLYYDRRQRQIELELASPQDVQGRVRAQLAIDQLTANLDALTGGWFSGQLGSGRR